MSIVRNALVCVLLASLILLTLRTAKLIQTVRGTVAILPVVTHAAIREQGELTRQAALAAITDTRQEALVEVRNTRAELMLRLDRVESSLDYTEGELADEIRKALAEFNHSTAVNLAEANKSLSSVARTVEAARPVLVSSAVLINDMRESWDDLYPDVKASVASGTVAARSVAEASTAVSQAAPVTARSVESITGSAASIAKSWEKRTPIYLRVLGWFGKGFIGVKALIN